MESRADINQVCKSEGIMRILQFMCRAYSSCRGEANLSANFFSNASTTPLGWCVIFDSEGLLTLLLRARADPEIRNNRGLRPIDMARSETIRAILQDPAPHIAALPFWSITLSWSLKLFDGAFPLSKSLQREEWKRGWGAGNRMAIRHGGFAAQWEGCRSSSQLAEQF